MFTWNWKKEILTIPNLLSLFRLGLIPVYVHLYLQARTRQDYLLAGTVMAISCLTDMIDGKVARQFHMVSHVGKVLDPLADKLTQLTLMLCLSAKYPLLHPVLALFVVKELFQLFAFLLYLRRGMALPGALSIGKISTAVLFVSLIALVLFPETDPVWTKATILADGIVLLFSFISYILAYWGHHRTLQDLE